MRLKEYLDSKPLYYKEIDYDRMPRIYEKIKDSFSKSKTIHLVGTNGKGTTGRFLASALNSLGFSVGHYTSPHILKFNERIWLSGENVSDDVLEKAHERLRSILTEEDADSLSYFEYTTFLSQLIFDKCEYIVQEAGLGGEHDATAVFDKDLTLITPIGYDHEAFLGDDIKDIAKTKLNAVQNMAILAQQPYDEVYDVAKELAASKGIEFKRVEESIDAKDKLNIENIANNLSLASYLKENLSLAISALNFLNIEYKKSDFKNARLFGRLTKYKDNVIVDVGHNVLAAKSVYEALKTNKFILVYNTYFDKNYKEILEVLKPIIQRIEIIKIDDGRIESSETLVKIIEDLDIKYTEFKELDLNKNYLVFGSFSVVETFLKKVGDV